MLWELLHWLVSFAEVIAVLVAILAVGLMIAMAVMWILSRGFRALSGVPDEPDAEEDEFEMYTNITTDCDEPAPADADCEHW